MGGCLPGLPGRSMNPRNSAVGSGCMRGAHGLVSTSNTRIRSPCSSRACRTFDWLGQSGDVRLDYSKLGKSVYFDRSVGGTWLASTASRT